MRGCDGKERRENKERWEKKVRSEKRISKKQIKYKGKAKVIYREKMKMR